MIEGGGSGFGWGLVLGIGLGVLIDRIVSAPRDSGEESGRLENPDDNASSAERLDYAVDAIPQQIKAKLQDLAAHGVNVVSERLNDGIGYFIERAGVKIPVVHSTGRGVTWNPEAFNNHGRPERPFDYEGHWT